MERMRKLRADISQHDSVERFTKLGVDVFIGTGRFVGPSAIEVDGKKLQFDRAVIASGARAAEPAIPGLSASGFYTNETIFTLTRVAAPLGGDRRRAHRLRAGAELSALRQRGRR